MHEHVATGNRVAVFLYLEGEPLRPADRHEAAVVRPGDHIVWAIRRRGRDSPPPRFSIRNVTRFANLEPGHEEAEDHQGIVWHKDEEEGTLIASHPGGPFLDHRRDRKDPVLAERALDLLRRMFDPRPNAGLDPSEMLFVDGWQPDGLGFQYGPIVSPPVNPELRGHWVWTYEWTISTKGESLSLDPHIYVHEGPGG